MIPELGLVLILIRFSCQEEKIYNKSTASNIANFNLSERVRSWQLIGFVIQYEKLFSERFKIKNCTINIERLNYSEKTLLKPLLDRDS